jgi:hypothetical protein
MSKGLSICRGTKLRKKQQLYLIVPPVSKLSGHPAWHNRVKLNRYTFHLHRFSSYLSCKPLLKRSTAFICNIDRDWIFWHRCLKRQTFGTPRMYTLSPLKSIKESNYREFLKVKNALLMYTTVLSLTAYKYAPNLESLLTQQYVCVMCTLIW